tara:strand:+ start:47 stop:337 length:291 start_codon:yes stop_codon:yes gene_type:complete
MDVRISYGIDIDEIPNKLIEMLNEVDMDEFYQLVSMSKQLIMLSDLETANKMVERARLKLASLDRSLNDTQMILGGYINAKNTQAGETKEDKENVD